MLSWRKALVVLIAKFLSLSMYTLFFLLNNPLKASCVGGWKWSKCFIPTLRTWNEKFSKWWAIIERTNVAALLTDKQRPLIKIPFATLKRWAGDRSHPIIIKTVRFLIAQTNSKIQRERGKKRKMNVIVTIKQINIIHGRLIKFSIYFHPFHWLELLVSTTNVQRFFYSDKYSWFKKKIM